MFHLSDLFSSAGTAPWEPPLVAPAHALAARYRRRRFATSPDDAPELKLPDAKYLTRLTTAALAADASPHVAAAVVGACLETPGLAYASAANDDLLRCWRRLSLLTNREVAGLLCVSGRPVRRGAIHLEEVTLKLCALSDVEGIRLMVEEVYMEGDRPERYVLNRGRATAPHAVWLGSPPGDESFARRLAAIGALAGYRIKIISDPVRDPRSSLGQIAGLAPELVLGWPKYLPPGDFMARVRKVVPAAAEVESVDATDTQAALEEAREWCTLAPVVTFAPTLPSQPRSMKEAALWAQKQVKYLVITDQAVARASRSNYESPEDVLHALVMLDQLAGDYADGSMDGSTFQETCNQRGLLYSRDITAATRQKHGARYLVTIDGEAQVMGPHLRFGDSFDPRYCARVYWWIDRSSRRLVVGHIGEHLPGADD